jgi:hypothetical protein
MRALGTSVLRAAVVVVACAAGLAQAGGPLNVCNNKPIVYTNPNVVLNTDNGPLNATHTKAQADALVAQSIALWTNVPTATVNLTLGASLASDMTASDWANPPNSRPLADATEALLANFSDGLNPVLYDADGSIIIDLFGPGNENQVLGFAGSAYFGSPSCHYAEGRAVINGFISVSDATIITTMAHEIGHLIGMDHTQLSSVQGLLTSNYPLMYPVAYRTAAGLGEDDAAAISMMYPDVTFNATYGTVGGHFTLADGTTAVQGANLWVKETTTNKVYSFISDYFIQGTGFYKFTLPAGNYTMHAEAIALDRDVPFTGGSGVGPFSNDTTGASFQPPLYPTGPLGAPMAPLTLGNGSPINFTVTTGCSRPSAFRMDGTGFVGPLGALPTDFNGDVHSDLLYRNVTTGQVYRVSMNGLAIASQGSMYIEPNTAWKIVATGDLNCDGVTDLVWRNGATGEVFVQLFAATGLPSSGAVVYVEPNPAWQIIGTADFDGDGMSDLVWYNSSTGQVYGMRMNGTTIAAQGMIYQEPNTQWRIVGIGDFAGSGKKNQLLWWNSSTGQVYLQTVTLSGGVFSQTGVMIYQEADTTWKIVGVGDFNSDGRTDFLWRNDTTGQVYMFLMTGPTTFNKAPIYTEPSATWQIVATGDFNGDGKSDILWRNLATGQVFMQLMNGFSIVSSGTVYTEPNLDWRVLGAYEFSH